MPGFMLPDRCFSKICKCLLSFISCFPSAGVGSLGGGRSAVRMFCWGFCDLAEQRHVKSTTTRAERQSVREQEWTNNVLVESRSLLSRSASARYLGYHCSPGCPARRTRYTCRYRVPRRTVHSTVGMSKPIRVTEGKPAKAQGQTLGENGCLLNYVHRCAAAASP